MNYLKQIIFELKNHKMITWVSISGTALAIFLIMAIFMSDRLMVISMRPDSNRHKIMSGQNMDFNSADGQSGSTIGIDYDLARKLYTGLDGVEKVSFISYQWSPFDVGLPKQNTISANGLKVDHEYWKLYDHMFLSGGPFEREEIEAGKKETVLTESVARKVFGESDVAGRFIDINNEPYLVKGVVSDIFPLLTDGTNNIFLNFEKGGPEEFGMGIFGSTGVRLLLKEGVSKESIKSQVEKRYDAVNRELEKDKKELVYHKQPYTSEELTAGSFGSNNDPKLETKARLRGLVYVILILLPAINLSSMTRSRLRQRISEIGVRRAFGAKKSNIVSQIFTENLIISFIGGALGLAFSLLFLAFLSGYFIIVLDSTFTSIAPVRVSGVVWQVFDFTAFFIAFGSCFILNVLSASVPSWKASSVEPAVALSKSR